MAKKRGFFANKNAGTIKYIFGKYICVCTYMPNVRFLGKFEQVLDGGAGDGGGGVFTPTAPLPQQNEPQKSPPRLGLRLS